MRLLIFVFLLCCPLTASAAEALSADTLKLDDGRVVRLLGIKGMGAGAQAALQTQITGKTLRLENASTDRYGRVTAEIYADTVWLQAALVQKGQAFVYPPLPTEAQVAQLLKLEQAARQARLGLWAEAAYADTPADNPAMGYGHFAFVVGKVVKAERIKNTFYLNFGEDWRQDFTVAIAARDLKLFHTAAIDPAGYQGKTIRVRGWIKRDFGPMIVVTSPNQIEVLGEAPVKP